MSTEAPLYISTLRISVFKTLFEALKEMLVDTCISFDSTGIKLLTIDANHLMIINMKLEADQLEYYHCAMPITFGVNMNNFFHIIKSANNGDTLTFYLDPSDTCKFDWLNIKIENAKKHMRTNYRLNLYDIDAESIYIEPIPYNCIIIMPSATFQKIIRDMKSFAKFVEIQNIENKVVFRAQGDFCVQETVLTDTQSTPQQQNDTPETFSRSTRGRKKTKGNAEESESEAPQTNPEGDIIIYNHNSSDKLIQGEFDLRYLANFIKCSQLSNMVELNLDNDAPLTIQYNIANLGYIRLCLSFRDRSEA